MRQSAGWSIRAREQRRPDMPLRGYFLFVGGALLTLLFAANWLLPSPPSNARIDSRPHLPNIRIYSELKGPDAIVIDTTKATMVQAPAAQMNIAGQQTASLAGPLGEQAGVPPDVAQATSASPELRESFAQFVPTPPKRAGLSEPKPRRRISGDRHGR